VDILVNNAGVTRDQLIMRMTDEEWDTVLNIDLKSAFLCTRAVLRPMMKQRWGRIINIASVVGIMGNASQANYASAKAGIIGLTKSIAKEVGSRDIGSTVLFVSKTSELVDPGPSSRMVFMDLGFGYDGALGTLDPQQESWLGTGEFTPIHHTDGTCVSFADGHVEYWKWMDPATVVSGRNWVNGTLFGLNRALVSGSGLSAKNPDAVRINMAFWGKWPLN
jgi:prepilin-type processing-associated H-X9-DG protein